MRQHYTSDTSTDDEDDQPPKWPIVVSGNTFKIDGPPLPERATETAMRHAKYAHYDPEKLPDGARIGYLWQSETTGLKNPDHKYRYGAYPDTDAAVKAAYNEEDGVMWEFVSSETHAYAAADDTDTSDRDLFEEAIEDIHVGGDETFRLWIEVEEHEPDYLGDRMVRADHITEKGESKEDASGKLCDRGVSGLGDLDISPARKFDHYDIETETLQDPETSTSYVWVRTEAGSDAIEILGRNRPAV